jgi:putative ABC transport system permease protein
VRGPIELSWLDLALAASLVLVNGLVSAWLGLGLGRKLLVAALRTVVQLLLLGYVLVAVFEWQTAVGVLAIGLAMIALAGRESIRRTGRRYAGIQLDAFVSLVVAGGGTALLATAAIVRVDPWWEPQYLIPLLGMVLGNALTGIGLGLERCMSQLDEGRARVELLLALGATRWEAARPVAGEAVRQGMIPILNSMSVVGLVTIPGMMTGQILGGVSPLLAARYQILIMFLISAATAAGVTGVVLLCVRALFDAQHRLRLERLHRR